MSDAVETVDEEALRVLTGLARGRFGSIAPERIAQHVLHVTREADWPVQRAALDALARRQSFAERDQLRVEKRIEGPGPRGVYSLRRANTGKRSEAVPYAVSVLSLEPLSTSCSCADFVRSSLGLCKHGLVVLASLDARGLAREPKLDKKGAPVVVEEPELLLGKGHLSWDPVHPLTGSGDRMERLHYQHAGRAQPLAGFRDGQPVGSQLQSPAQRLLFIAELERAIGRASVTAEPSVLRLLEEERLLADRQIENGPGAGPAMKSLSRLRRKLYPYQREGVKRFFDSGRLLLADDMGLGKTMQAIAACHGLFETGRIKRGLLIVPAPLKPQWKREWDATTDVPLTVVEGSPAERARIYQGTKRGFLVMGYEQLLRDLEHVQQFAAELVVLDEAQRIKNWATKSAAYVKSLSPAYRLVLTGTPMENRFDELASVMDFVDDLALEPKWRLVPFHTIRTESGGSGARNLDVLRQRLSASMLRRVRKEVLSQLPARTDTRVPVEMTDQQREQHDELRQPVAELTARAARRPLKPAEFMQLMQLLTRQRMICNGMAQVQFESEWPRCQSGVATPETLASLFAPKLSVLRGLIEQIVVAQGRKVVVFSQWRNMLLLCEWAVRDVLAEAGLRAVFFTGAESSRQRERAIADLHDDASAGVLFLSDAGAVGLNLQRAASCCINLELPWNPALLEQRIGRIYRLGQTLPIDVYNLVTEEGIEARIALLLGNKKALSTTLFDGTSDEVMFDGSTSFMDSVKQLVDAVPVLGGALEGVGEEESAASEARVPSPAPSPVEPPAVTRAVTPLGTLLQSLSVSRLPDGKVRVEAPAELAVPLAEWLEGLAKSLRGADA